jgi:hypothetical protein
MLEVIGPQDWDDYSAEKRSGYESVRLFKTEQEADKFAAGLVEAAKLVRTKLPRR